MIFWRGPKPAGSGSKISLMEKKIIFFNFFVFYRGGWFYVQNEFFLSKSFFLCWPIVSHDRAWWVSILWFIPICAHVRHFELLKNFGFKILKQKKKFFFDLPRFDRFRFGHVLVVRRSRCFYRGCAFGIGLAMVWCST